MWPSRENVPPRGGHREAGGSKKHSRRHATGQAHQLLPGAPAGTQNGTFGATWTVLRMHKTASRLADPARCSAAQTVTIRQAWMVRAG